MKKKLNNDEDLQKSLDEAFEHWKDNHYRQFEGKTYHTSAMFQSIKTSVKFFMNKRIEVLPGEEQ